MLSREKDSNYQHVTHTAKLETHPVGPKEWAEASQLKAQDDEKNKIPLILPKQNLKNNNTYWPANKDGRN